MNDSLIQPCDCSGSMRYIHFICLQTWLKSRSSNIKKTSNTYYTSYFLKNQLDCELCKKPIPDKIKQKNKIFNILEFLNSNYKNYIILESLLNGNDRRNYPNSRQFYALKLDEKDYFRIGRGHEADLRLNDISISRIHAKLIFSKKINNSPTFTNEFANNVRLTIHDCDSKFGTLIYCYNSKLPIVKQIPLTIQIGRSLLNFIVKKPFSLTKCLFSCLTCSSKEKDNNKIKYLEYQEINYQTIKKINEISFKRIESLNFSEETEDNLNNSEIKSKQMGNTQLNTNAINNQNLTGNFRNEINTQNLENLIQENTDERIIHIAIKNNNPNQMLLRNNSKPIIISSKSKQKLNYEIDNIVANVHLVKEKYFNEKSEMRISKSKSMDFKLKSNFREQVYGKEKENNYNDENKLIYKSNSFDKKIQKEIFQIKAIKTNKDNKSNSIEIEEEKIKLEDFDMENANLNNINNFPIKTDLIKEEKNENHNNKFNINESIIKKSKNKYVKAHKKAMTKKDKINIKEDKENISNLNPKEAFDMDKGNSKCENINIKSNQTKYKGSTQKKKAKKINSSNFSKEFLEEVDLQINKEKSGFNTLENKLSKSKSRPKTYPKRYRNSNNINFKSDDNNNTDRNLLSSCNYLQNLPKNLADSNLDKAFVNIINKSNAFKNENNVNNKRIDYNNSCENDYERNFSNEKKKKIINEIDSALSPNYTTNQQFIFNPKTIDFDQLIKELKSDNEYDKKNNSKNKNSSNKSSVKLNLKTGKIIKEQKCMQDNENLEGIPKILLTDKDLLINNERLNKEKFKKEEQEKGISKEIIIQKKDSQVNESDHTLPLNVSHHQNINNKAQN